MWKISSGLLHFCASESSKNQPPWSRFYRCLWPVHFAFTTFSFFVLFAEGLGCSELGSMEADPDDCGSFLICNHNEYQKMACRDGTHYDPQVKVCNHPDQVKCEVGGNSVKPIRIRLEK